MALVTPAAQPTSRAATMALTATLALQDRWVRLLSVYFLVGQLLDTVTTHVALASGRFQEANPVFAPLLGTNEMVGMAMKGLVAVTVLMAALNFVGRSRRVFVLGLLAALSLEAPVTNALRLLGLL